MRSLLLKGLHVKIRYHDDFKLVSFTDGVKFPLNKPKFGNVLFSKLAFTYKGEKYELYSFNHGNGHGNLITVPNGKRYEYFPSGQIANLSAFKTYMDMGFPHLKG